jgi:hypothetical protein
MRSRDRVTLRSSASRNCWTLLSALVAVLRLRDELLRLLVALPRPRDDPLLDELLRADELLREVERRDPLLLDPLVLLAWGISPPSSSLG